MLYDVNSYIVTTSYLLRRPQKPCDFVTSGTILYFNVDVIMIENELGLY